MIDFFKASERGTEAAWEGFSSQTIYITYRLMVLDVDNNFFPEKVEDLMIKDKNDSIIELVQIKNISSKDLSLSDLSPNSEDSFFKRCLALKNDNKSLILKIVSFGNVSEELNSINTKNLMKL